MKCYFLRHGAAAEPDTWQGSDFDRPLTPEGRKRITAEAEALGELKLELDAIVTSPLLRAKQTAELVADALKIRKRLREDERAGVDFNSGSLGEIFRDQPDAEAVMVVGHEPSMSRTIGAVTGGARIDFKKGGLACVEFADRSSLQGELLWLLPPKILLRT